MTSTFRRIGEELYKSFYKNDYYNDVSNNINNNNIKQPQSLAMNLLADDYTNLTSLNTYEPKDTDRADSVASTGSSSNQFMQSDVPQIRILSCMIILRTLNQGN